MRSLACSDGSISGDGRRRVWCAREGQPIPGSKQRTSSVSPRAEAPRHGIGSPPRHGADAVTAPVRRVTRPVRQRLCCGVDRLFGGYPLVVLMLVATLTTTLSLCIGRSDPPKRVLGDVASALDALFMLGLTGVSSQHRTEHLERSEMRGVDRMVRECVTPRASRRLWHGKTTKTRRASCSLRSLLIRLPRGSIRHRLARAARQPGRPMARAACERAPRARAGAVASRACWTARYGRRGHGVTNEHIGYPTQDDE